MTRPDRVQTAPVRTAARGWRWPVNLAAYNQRPGLTHSERADLAALVRHCEAGRAISTVHDYPSLRRLVAPLSDALTLICARDTRPQDAHWAVLRILTHEMHQRQSAFWAWTEEDWIDLLGANRAMYAQRYPRQVSLRQHVIAVGYLLGDFRNLHALGQVSQSALVYKVFGQQPVDAAATRVVETAACWGYSGTEQLTRALFETLLTSRSPLLTDLTRATLETARQHAVRSIQDDFVGLSRALVELGILASPLAPADGLQRYERKAAATRGIAGEWLAWCQRWHQTTTVAPGTRNGGYNQLLIAGRWLAQEHPDITRPDQWTRDLAAAYVAAVDRMTVGQWAQATTTPAAKRGKPLAARTKATYLGSMRTFFRDCQEWGWIARTFDPRRCFRPPLSIRALLGPQPRVIADDCWLKLLWAGLNVTADDLPRNQSRWHTTYRRAWYPVEMVRALTIVWLFAGLRADEIARLRLGCIRWQRDEVQVAGTDDVLPKDAICWLDVPRHKTGGPFTKPVDRVVGEAIQRWERQRPEQPAAVDPKTGEAVQYLFAYRGYRVGQPYLNQTLIPLLCRKAGIPERDARGRITSHRARATIATQLFNAKEPMTLFELQEWLGHRSPHATQYYVKISPTKLAKSYADAGYFARNIRMIDVLIDQDAIKGGAAAAEQPWRFYDLGHGYCTYDFFDQCPHRMACAKCTFYRPKGSSQAQLLEAKTNLLHLKQEIPLTDEERAAVDDGLLAMEHLCATLADTPTPAGPTPRELQATGRLVLPTAPPAHNPLRTLGSDRP